MARLFVVGDTHGSADVQKLNTTNFPVQKELTEEDVVVQLGDFGCYWGNKKYEKEDKYWLNWHAAKRYTTAFLDGNHDNHQMIWNLPLESKWGGLVNVDHRGAGDIYYLRRGEVYVINKKKLLVVGGAQSIDRHLRTEGVDWWPTEELSRNNTENALDNLDLHNRKVDYVLSHTCPDFMVHRFTESKTRMRDSVAQFLGHVDNITEFKEWHFGHMHRDWVEVHEGAKYQCHYNGVPHEL